MSRSQVRHVLTPLLLLLAHVGPAVVSTPAQEPKPDPSPLVAPFDLAQANAGQAAWARHLKVERNVTAKSGIELVLIPPGEYLRGTSAADVATLLKADAQLKATYFAAEQPQHGVRITQPFYMAKFETTQEQFEKLLERNSAAFSAMGDRKSRVTGMNTADFPVERVTWYDCIEFCNKLSEAEGKSPCYALSDIERSHDESITSATVGMVQGTGYRLPTEAEWEYACRAGTTTVFHFGNQLNAEQANVNGKYPFGTTTEGPYLWRTNKVGTHAANNFGLHDMCGNVWEWCQDGYGESAYGEFASKTAVDPVVEGGVPFRVLRGGSWYSNGRFARSASRFKMIPGSQHNIYGFRVVCAIK